MERIGIIEVIMLITADDAKPIYIATIKNVVNVMELSVLSVVNAFVN